uniref:Predicted protein n=1 Tax=Hordeum vulgare subsp. vulgare TaxID=112509 RepID=F2E852_HORVV|nr:predicted protein [Hordeum vulgare subsp. vulgare]
MMSNSFPFNIVSVLSKYSKAILCDKWCWSSRSSMLMLFIIYIHSYSFHLVSELTF